MFKFCILLSLAVASAYGQLAPAGGEAAPEPYSYGYETDTHAAAEQKDPNGRVTGYYTLTDADGRARRVEYFADETGFHAKVQSNEVGTKSENSADVEVLASPPTREQYVYQQAPVAQAPVVQAPVAQKTVATVASTVARGQPNYAQYGYNGYNSNYGYYPGYGYNSQYGYASPAYGYSGYGAGYGLGYNSAYGGYGAGYGNSAYGNSAYGSGLYSSYNNHLPSSYYKSVQSVAGVQPSSYSSGGLVGRYAVSNPVVGAVGSGYRTVGVPVGVGYQSAVVNPQRVAYSSSSSVPVGSSNYIVLKKRESEAKAEAQTEAKNDVNKS